MLNENPWHRLLERLEEAETTDRPKIHEITLYEGCTRDGLCTVDCRDISDISCGELLRIVHGMTEQMVRPELEDIIRDFVINHEVESDDLGYCEQCGGHGYKYTARVRY